MALFKRKSDGKPVPLREVVRTLRSPEGKAAFEKAKREEEEATRGMGFFERRAYDVGQMKERQRKQRQTDPNALPDIPDAGSAE
jgi:hypothetical protein